jgi:hypothetical protein
LKGIDMRHIPALHASTLAAERTIRFLAVQFFVLIYFQKIGISISESYSIGIPFVVFFSLAGLALTRRALTVDPSRMLLFVLLAIFAIASQLVVARFSFPSLMFFLMLNSAFTLSWKLTSEDYERVCKIFSSLMFLPAIFVFVQYVYELHYGLGISLSLEKIIPRSLLTLGYIYEGSSEAWVVWNRPNGLVFLEPSYCSAFLACAFINEVYVLRRYAWAALFLASLLATNGGTGLVMIGIALPVIGLMRKPAATIAVAIIGFAVLALAGAISSDLPLLSRLKELGETQTSGYGRLVAPLQALITLAPNPELLFSGHGAGEVPPAFGSPWPITKLIYEYGLLTALVYVMLICRSFSGGYNAPLRAALFVVFQFTGSYLLSPFLIFLIFLTCMGRAAPGAASSLATRDATEDASVRSGEQKPSSRREYGVPT